MCLLVVDEPTFFDGPTIFVVQFTFVVEPTNPKISFVDDFTFFFKLMLICRFWSFFVVI